MVGKQTSHLPVCQGIFLDKGATMVGEISLSSYTYPRGFFIKSSANYGNEGEKRIQWIVIFHCPHRHAIYLFLLGCCAVCAHGGFDRSKNK